MRRTSAVIELFRLLLSPSEQEQSSRLYNLIIFGIVFVLLALLAQGNLLLR